MQQLPNHKKSSHYASSPLNPNKMSPSSFLHSIASLGTGYALAITLCSLVLLSSLLLASYICFRSRRQNPNPNPNPIAILPRILFVAEEEDDEESGGAVGLDPAAIGSYPKFRYASSAKGEESVCSICLCEYMEGEVLRMMPDCRHYFHLTCIGAWLRLNASCPVCRTSPMPTPVSTPLSELVPLSQYSADRRGRG